MRRIDGVKTYANLARGAEPDLTKPAVAIETPPPPSAPLPQTTRGDAQKVAGRAGNCEGASFGSGSIMQQRMRDFRAARPGSGTTLELGKSWAQREEVLTDVRAYVGRVITPDEKPALYALLGPAFERLAAHQEERAVGVALGELIIVDHPEPVTFMQAVHNNGVDSTLSMVFVTSGFLKEMLALHESRMTSAEAVHATLLDVLGAAAHGLGRGVIVSEELREDDIDGRQARSLRADAEGVLLLRDAGLPPEAMLRFIEQSDELSRLRKPIDQKNLYRMAKTAFRTEGGFAVRRAAVNGMLTLQRYERGLSKASFDVPAAVATAIANEVATLLPRLTNTFTPPTSFAETMERLQPYIKSNSERRPTYDVVQRGEVQQLIRSLQRSLPNDAAELDDVQREQMRQLILSARTWHKWLSPDVTAGWEGREGGVESWWRLVNEHAFFKSEAWEQSVLELVPELDKMTSTTFEWSSEDRNAHNELPRIRANLQALAMALPPTRIVALYGAQLEKAMLKQVTGDLGTVKRLADVSLPIELNLLLGNAFIESFWQRLGPSAHASLMNGRQLLDVYGGAEDVSRGVAALRREARLRDKPELTAVADAYDRNLAMLWEQRGYLAALEAIYNPGSVDWATIATAANVEQAAVPKSLRNALTAWATAPATEAPDARLPRAASYPMAALLGAHTYDRLSVPERKDDDRNFHVGVGLAGGGIVSASSHDLRGQPASVAWMDPSMYAMFAGLPEQVYAKPILLTMLDARPDIVDRLARNTVRHAMRGLSATTAPYEVVSRLADSMDPEVRRRCDLNLYAEEIARAAIPQPLKRELLTAIYLRREGERVMGNYAERRAGHLMRAATILLEQGVVRHASEIIAEVREPRFYDEREKARRLANGGTEDRWYRLGWWGANLVDLLIPELDAHAGDHDALKARVTTLAQICGYDDNTSTTKLKNALANAARTLTWDPDKRIPDPRDYSKEPRTVGEAEALFVNLVHNGATNATDLFFADVVFPQMTNPDDVRQVVEKHKIRSTRIALELVRELLEPNIKAIEAERNGRALTRAAAELVAVLDEWVPEASLAKDEFLENLAWRLRFSGRNLKGLIEDRKSYNFRKTNGLLANLGSSLSDYIGQMNPNPRRALLEHLIAPNGGQLPTPVRVEMQAHVRAMQLQGVAEKLASSVSNVALDAGFEKLLFETSTRERLPLVEMLLGSGPNALCKAADFPRNITRDFLGYAEDSREEKLLHAFLEVIPENERTVTLAYMLTHLSPGDSSEDNIKALFEVFQSVGIKLGQLISIWRVFGEEFSERTRGLRDNAAPMTKQQIEDVMDASLTSDERKRVELLEIIGSASMKTVVRVLVDGREAVMMVQRPHAAETVPTNLDLGRRFIERVQAKNIDMPTAMLEMLIDPLEEQMVEEMRMTGEAERIDKAAGLMPAIGARLSAEADGWTFEVPRVLTTIRPRDNLMFVELAQGVSFDDLATQMPAEDHAALGRFVVKSQLQMLFGAGVFDPDRHFGNWKFDALRKVISAFDFGQLETYPRTSRFSPDDRMAIARFLQGADQHDPSIIAEALTAMATKATGAKVDVARLKAQVAKTLAENAGKPLEDQMTALISAASEAGLKLQKKFVFGALKGLLVLAREGYVSGDEFTKLIKAEVTTLLHAKAPALAVAAVKRTISAAAAIYGGLRT